MTHDFVEEGNLRQAIGIDGLNIDNKILLFMEYQFIWTKIPVKICRFLKKTGFC
jgi:hypothetical protein